MNSNTIKLRSINDLVVKNEKFYIPSYQRGYRWTERQVNDLLNDLWSFQEDEANSDSEFYCLQPLVVIEKDSEWVLIDGQQRLTTIYLILQYLSDVVKLLGKKPYSIRYQTRKKSKYFLENINFEQRNDNVDYFHICNAYKTIEKWFENKDGTAKFNFIRILLNEEKNKNVKVIWYEVSEESNQVDIFTRLNMGKIPLTNSELIKALFLRSNNFGSEITEKTHIYQLKIANEWDYIEKILQNDAFWYFITNNNKSYPNRIEYLFEQMANEMSNSVKYKTDIYYTFLVFHERFGADIDIEREWKSVKDCFMTFEQWYNDRELFHLIGFLINQGYSINEIKSYYKNNSKTAFKVILKKNVLSCITNNKEDIGEVISILKYGEEKVKSVLLLFNIITLLQNPKSNGRFQFDLYKQENWDIEHIRSVSENKPGRVDEQKKWLMNIVEYFTGAKELSEQENILSCMEEDEDQSLCKECISLLKDDVLERNSFDNIYNHILKYFHEEVERDTDNSIGNLVLLDAATNRSYKNAVFPIKRKVIMNNDKTGTFIPIATKNVFLKYYSEKIDKMMYWNEDDRRDYENVIISSLSNYFKNI